MRRAPKPKTGKKVAYKLLDPATEIGKAMYARLDELLEHPKFEELRDARFAMAWCTSWRPDVDGRIVLGKCKLSSELDREFHRFNFTIILNQAWWYDLRTTDAQRRAVLFHELKHAAPAIDERTGEQKEDERGRKLWRMRKHDVEEFTDVLEEFGTYKRDVERAYEAIVRNAQRGFVSCGTCDARGFLLSEDGQTMRRCECWTQHQMRVHGKLAVAS